VSEPPAEFFTTDIVTQDKRVRKEECTNEIEEDVNKIVEYLCLIGSGRPIDAGGNVPIGEKKVWDLQSSAIPITKLSSFPVAVANVNVTGAGITAAANIAATTWTLQYNYTSGANLSTRTIANGGKYSYCAEYEFTFSGNNGAPVNFTLNPQYQRVSDLSLQPVLRNAQGQAQTKTVAVATTNAQTVCKFSFPLEFSDVGVAVVQMQFTNDAQWDSGQEVVIRELGIRAVAKKGVTLAADLHYFIVPSGGDPNESSYVLNNRLGESVSQGILWDSFFGILGDSNCIDPNFNVLSLVRRIAPSDAWKRIITVMKCLHDSGSVGDILADLGIASFNDIDSPEDLFISGGVFTALNFDQRRETIRRLTDKSRYVSEFWFSQNPYVVSALRKVYAL
jgi:hypothetical protein